MVQRVPLLTTFLAHAVRGRTDEDRRELGCEALDHSAICSLYQLV